MNFFLRFFQTVFWVAMALNMLLVVYGKVHRQIERVAQPGCKQVVKP